MTRLPQNPAKVPLKVAGKFKLKNHVVSSTKERLVGICITEMQQLFLCFKNYSFNEEACAKEITAFQSCYNMHLAKHNKLKDSTKEKKYNLGINGLLKLYPEKIKK